jgi:hypothetical protein
MKLLKLEPEELFDAGRSNLIRRLSCRVMV